MAAKVQDGTAECPKGYKKIVVTVTDAGDGTPIKKASVTIMKAKESKRAGGCTLSTNAEGKATFSVKSRGTYIASATADFSNQAQTPAFPFDPEERDKEFVKKDDAYSMALTQTAITITPVITAAETKTSCFNSTDVPGPDPLLVEVSMTVSNERSGYTGGAKLTVPDTVELFTDEACTAALAADGGEATLTNEQLTGPQKLKLYLRGKAGGDGGTATLKLTADAAVRDAITVADPVEVAFEITVKALVFLLLGYKDPEGNAHPFPKDFPAQLAVEGVDEAETLKLLDDTGALQFSVEKDKTFVLSFDSTKTRVFSHDAPIEADKVPTLLENKSDDDLRALSLAGKLFFSLPKAWKLHQSTWTATDITVPKDGKIVAASTGIGTKDSPAKLVLEPKLHHFRFEFFDRKFGHSDHSDKLKPIPAVVLKGARKADAAGAPVEPVAGTHDAVSNWVVKADDDAKACQCLPWIITKKADDGADLPKLDKATLVEFAWPKGFVHSESATVRKIVKLEANDDKLKPTKTRNTYYDLPKIWKSKCYYTRLTADTGKFFDELSSDEVEAAFDVAKPLVFSLDDVVLTTGTSQALKDKDGADTDKDLTKHSRFAVLHLDPEDGYKVKVHDPRDKAPFHSKGEFKKDGASKYRNVLLDLTVQARVIVFCSKFHDLYDKRTETADFTKSEILGARAAKVEDTDVSLKKVFSRSSDVNKGYVFAKRIAHVHYLHYCATDGTTVYGALVHYWTAKFFYEDDELKCPAGWPKDKFFKIKNSTNRGNGTLADKRNYIEKGFGNAMVGWNQKDYQLEEHDDTKDIAIKTFSLFESKELEDPDSAGSFIALGGKPMCTVAICKNSLGSWASARVMRMRCTAFQGEGGGWGSAANTEARLADYDGTTAPARNAFVHELGHAAAGVLDDYVYNVENFRGLVRYQQYYPGMPYKRDKSSLMSVNQAVRMRMYWGRTSWVNDEAKGGKTLNKFLSAKKFKLTYAPAGKTKLNFDLSGDTFRDIYKPAESQLNYSLGEQGKCDAFLYKLGDGEFSHLLKGGPYKGMLCVNFKLSPKFKNGLDPAPAAWVTATAYSVGTCVKKSNKFYGCLAVHTSGTFNTDLGAKKWIELKLDKPRYDWSKGTNADGGDEWYSDDAGANYFVVKDHTSGQATADQWFEIGADKGAWAAATAYTKKEQVQESGKNYVCKKAHTSTDTFATDLADNWLLKGSDKGAFAGGTAYAVSDVATLGGKKYACILAHTAETAEADAAIGRLLKTNSKLKIWSGANKRDWCIGLDTALVTMLEGADGKFKLTNTDGTNDFSNTYVRIYPQWEIPADNAVAEAGTHYTFEVTYDGGTSFDPTGTAIKVSNACENKTIIRYLLGKLSDVTDDRASQELTADLAKADLGKLKAWIEGKAGGTFTVADIT
jgi:hypothetical protein